MDADSKVLTMDELFGYIFSLITPKNGPKKYQSTPKIILFMSVDHAKEFSKLFHSSNSFLSELLPDGIL